MSQVQGTGAVKLGLDPLVWRTFMDKKVKKRLEILHQKLQHLQLQLAGCRQQTDEPNEVRRLETEVAAVEAEIRKWKGG